MCFLNEVTRWKTGPELNALDVRCLVAIEGKAEVMRTWREDRF
jgi:hypothetical protein